MATFGWRRHGLWLSSDSISMNSTQFSLTLSNLRDDDAGRYSCAAQGVLSIHTKDVNLCIKGSYTYTVIDQLNVIHDELFVVNKFSLQMTSTVVT